VSIEVIIFGSIRFLSKKITKPIFFKTETGPNRPVLVRFGFLGQKPVWLGFLPVRFGFFGFGFGSVRFFWF
jgi:hypothetical protein